MKYTKKQAMQMIVDVAKEYQQKLKDKNFLVIYQYENKIRKVKVGFRSSHFLHMTGIETKLSAKRFFDKCVAGKLSLSDFELDTKGKAQRKLSVLSYVPDLLYNPCMIGDFINSGICIKADYFVGNTKAVLSVGFRHGKDVDFPVTVYKEDVRKLSQPTCKVLAIFWKKYNEAQYEEIAYLAKGYEIEKLLEKTKKSNTCKES